MSEQSQYYYLSISEAKIRIARTYYLNLISFCRKYAIFTRFYELMLQKVLKFANYAVAVLVLKIMLSCTNYAKSYASTIRQCLLESPRRNLFKTGMKTWDILITTYLIALLHISNKNTPFWFETSRHIKYFEN